MDRTRDFLRYANSASLQSPAQPVSASAVAPLGAPAPLDAPRPAATYARTSQVHQSFNSRASDISKGIAGCSVLLSRLTTLASSQSLFQESDEEVNRLTATVQDEIAGLKRKLADLQGWLNKNDLGGGRDVKAHSEAVVKTMEFKLQDSGKAFFKVLESRKTALEAQSQRKRMFGGDDDEDLDMGKPLSFSHVPMVPNTTPGSSAQHRSSNGSPRHHHGEGYQLLPQQQQQQQHTLLIPEQQYLTSRVDAISAVEKHISELGQLMSTLAVMVHEQDHLVTDLSHNVDNARLDVRAGYAELVRYYESIRGNRQLMARLFVVLVTFLTFFMFFLA